MSRSKPQGVAEIRQARAEGRALFLTVILFSIFVNLLMLSKHPVVAAF